MNNLNEICLMNVTWIRLGKNGLIEDFSKLNNQAGIYIYQSKDSKIYIGSTSNLAQRINQHRRSINNGNKACPKFYNCVNKYG